MKHDDSIPNDNLTTEMCRMHGEAAELSAEVDRLRTRLAAYERATVKRDDSVPWWAVAWCKDEHGHIDWAMAKRKDAAPDLRPDEPGPITLPIVDVE